MEGGREWDVVVLAIRWDDDWAEGRSGWWLVCDQSLGALVTGADSEGKGKTRFSR